MTRRRALAGLAGFLAGAPLLRAQQDARRFSEHRRALGIDEMKNVWDFEAVFGANVSQAIRDSTAHGDGTEWTLRRNREAFEWVDLVPGKAVDPESVNLSTTIYQTAMNSPIMIAPTSGHGRLHPEGEAASQRGATAAGTPYIVANGPTVPLAKIAAADKGPLWYQLYARQDVEANRAVLEEAQALGCQAIVITVDQQASYYPRTQHDRNLGGAVRGAARAGGAAAVPAKGPALYRVSTPGRLWYTWQWVDEVRKFIKVPVLMKGIVTAEDAQICVDRGLGIIVSNHGGRSLDFAESALENLPEVASVANGRVPVLFDSGIRRGTDVLKALAMGANAVCVGRAQLWGLGAFGAPGVQRVLEILQAELVQAAAAHGHAGLASINKAAVRVNFS
jgi:isopentenyl diphosphate isomerase/L-lactate dehydrogenase-like FMN-dependent dehydrogenase